MTAAVGAPGAGLEVAVDGVGADMLLADMAKTYLVTENEKGRASSAALHDDPAKIRHRSRANARASGRRLRWIK